MYARSGKGICGRKTRESPSKVCGTGTGGALASAGIVGKGIAGLVDRWYDAWLDKMPVLAVDGPVLGPLFDLRTEGGNELVGGVPVLIELGLELGVALIGGITICGRFGKP